MSKRDSSKSKSSSTSKSSTRKSTTSTSKSSQTRGTSGSKEEKPRELILKVSHATLADPFTYPVSNPDNTFYEVITREAKSNDAADKILDALSEESNPVYDPFVGDREIDTGARLGSIETQDKAGDDVIDIKLRVRRSK